MPLARSLQSSPKDLIEQRTSSDDRKTLDTSCFCAGLFERFVLYIFRVLETINFTNMWEVFIPAVFKSLYRKVTPCSLYGCLMRKDWPCSFCWCQRLSKTFFRVSWFLSSWKVACLIFEDPCSFSQFQGCVVLSLFFIIWFLLLFLSYQLWVFWKSSSIYFSHQKFGKENFNFLFIFKHVRTFGVLMELKDRWLYMSGKVFFNFLSVYNILMQHNGRLQLLCSAAKNT